MHVRMYLGVEDWHDLFRFAVMSDHSVHCLWYKVQYQVQIDLIFLHSTNGYTVGRYQWVCGPVWGIQWSSVGSAVLSLSVVIITDNIHTASIKEGVADPNLKMNPGL